VVGPLVGAAAYHSIRDVLMPLTDHWRLLLGLAIIAIVLALPRGIVGGALILRARLGWNGAAARARITAWGSSASRGCTRRSAGSWRHATSRSRSRRARCWQ